MIWIMTKSESLQITRCNTFEKDGRHQVWVERVGGKTFKLKESDNKAEIEEIKDAIDFAIGKKEPVLDLKANL